MNQYSKVQIGVGEKPIHRFPKNYNHVTTGTFMQFGLATVMEMPKSGLHCKHKTFLRTMPLKRPLMTNINIHKQAYFVPYRTVWEPWSDFRTDTPHNQPQGTGIIPNTPLIALDDLLAMFFLDQDFSRVAEDGVVTDEHSYDFNDANSNRLMNFTPFGRWAYKLFCSMGLSLPLGSFGLFGKEETIDALPFLAVAKVYLDYFFPNQYAHYGVYATIDGIMQRQVTYTLTAVEIKTILQAIYKVSYESDYFVSAFDKPLLSADGVQSNDFNIHDISLDLSDLTSNNVSAVKQASNGTPVLSRESVGTGQTAGIIYNMSAYIENQLKALTTYIRRHSLAGSRALTRYLADWGVALSADKLKRCYKLGEVVFPLEVGDVTSQSDTYNEADSTGAQLGDFAGRAVAFNGNFDFDCDTDEDGLLVVTYSIVPSVSYVQGIQRYWYHKTKLDFLTGDFDGITTREIRQIELFAGLKSTVSLSGIFGFTQQYADLKIDYDVLSGDFRVPTKNLGLFGFESCRLFPDESGVPFDEVHGLDFVLANDSQQYNRIFFEDEGLADKFVLVHRAEFVHNLPAVPLYDNFDFEDAKKKVLMEVNGSKDN